MLGRLARWLRILGYDTAYEKVITDESLVERTIQEDRWLLTRDRRLVLRKLLRGRHTLIASDHLNEQLRQLRDECHLPLDLSMDRGYRCADCNQRLVEIPREEAVSKVPPLVAEQDNRFMRCRSCGRVYWPGMHWTNIRRQLAQLAKEPQVPHV
jgi:uncharacterized protein with PIN domain